jgi:hypothetical protein
MAIILGLDVSTSCTGICVVDSTVQPDDTGNHVLHVGAISFAGAKTMWEKADVVADAMKELTLTYTGERAIDRVVLEEALLGFRPGMSSAMTISTLMRFNGIVSYISRNVFDVEPEYIGSSHARKLCGIKLQRTATAGMNQKEQVFKHMSENDLRFKQWPLKKSGNVVDWSRDATDAYVIARAAAIEGIIVPTKKQKKLPKPAGGCAYPCDPPCPGKPMKGLMMCRKHQPFPA